MPAYAAVQQSPVRTVKEARIEARVTEEMKETWEYAAALNGLSLTDFLKTAMQSASVQTIRNKEVLTLSERGRVAFAQALLNPPPPNEVALSAANRYKRWAATK
jgi:uncharacterized protein (DUF1778 family)